MMTASVVADLGRISWRARERLIERLRRMGVTSQEVLDVLRALPRDLFVDEALASRAYADSALPIGWGQTISQPYTVARMTEALLQGRRCDTVLEIGTGSGFHTAVLASLVRRVYSVERIGDLMALAARRLQSLKLRNVRLRHADGALGWPEYAPFDGILVTAAAAQVPNALFAQLADDGCLVMPIGQPNHQQLLRIVRSRRGWRREALEPVSFVPLLEGTC